MGETTISVKNVFKSYPVGDQRLLVLEGLSLDVHASELVAVMGRSGSGKSTLLNLIAALETSDTGEIFVKQQALHQMNRRQRILFRRDNLGIIYQFFNLVPSLTVEENILLPFLIAGDKNPAMKTRLEEVLEFTGIASRRRHLPSQLSGGEMQLVSIARTLIRQPGVILADEPTGNVNLETGKLIMKKLQEVTRISHASIILVTHSPEDASWADRIVFLKNGQIEPKYSLNKGETDVFHIFRRLEELGI
ncbi:ABC transporter ATP-binding protein [candidate division KSB1 bacterium]|nr:ABC transporter ATP-binding protein [candidate division KSB1 bacterium]